MARYRESPSTVFCFPNPPPFRNHYVMYAMARHTYGAGLTLASIFLLAGRSDAILCDTCHLYNDYSEYGAADYGATKEAATPTDFPLGGRCSQYRHASCCTVTVANNLAELYGDDYNFETRCGGMSSKCSKYFYDEACFYECDVNAGRFRRHAQCEDNAWEMYKAPVRASFCDDFYEACKDDKFCNSEDRSFFGDCNPDTDCAPIGDIYKNGKDLCETMWGDAFVYETNEREAFTWYFPPGEANPNDLVLAEVEFPETCDGVHNGSAAELCPASGLLQQNLVRAVSELEAKLDDSSGDGNAKDIAIAALVFGLLGFVIGAFLMFSSMCGSKSNKLPDF